jgi:hypothetical protein
MGLDAIVQRAPSAQRVDHMARGHIGEGGDVSGRGPRKIAPYSENGRILDHDLFLSVLVKSKFLSISAMR